MSEQGAPTNGIDSASNTRDPEEPGRNEWKKYKEYQLRVEPDQDDRASEVKFCRISRPHMRAFHLAWWSLLVSFLMLSATGPLLTDLREDIGSSKQLVWRSSIMAISGAMVAQFLLGPCCDVFGARIPVFAILCMGAIATGSTGALNSAMGLLALRFFIGTSGGCFVISQYWSSRMFSKQVVGSANALVAGWGILGRELGRLVSESLLLSLHWRFVSTVPASIAFVTGLLVPCFSDDSPKGNYRELKENGVFAKTSVIKSLVSGALHFNTWLLCLQYTCCYGTELTMFNAAALYMRMEYSIDVDKATRVATSFVWLSFIGRWMGGRISDLASSAFSMRGRKIVQAAFLALAGVLIFVFANTRTEQGSTASLAMFSMVVQAAQGSTFGIVPYVDPANTGSVIGIVAMGGQAGVLLFGNCFNWLQNYEYGFVIMGAANLFMGLLSVFICS